MTALFTATAFVAAALLFMVQPMFGRMALPLLGGSPAVWNTAMLFFQATLLAGYGYAHLLTRGGTRRRLAVLHVVLLALAFFLLPIRIPTGWSPPAESNPTPWLLSLLAVAVGLPFLLVSTTGPLVQHWFASTGHPRSGDPYFLYAASNLGSFVGLLAYPFVIEPHLPLAAQSRLWSAGYLALVALILACALRVAAMRTRAASHASAGPPPGHAPDGRGVVLAAGEAQASNGRRVAGTSNDEGGRISLGRRARWVLLALAPSSLMLGATGHLSTDIAAIPLLWVIPLALYLLAFALAFARRSQFAVAAARRAMPFLVPGLVVVMQARAAQPLGLVIALHLATLFVLALACDGALAADRPSPTRLTEYYLWIALGGALGGVFNALVAPVVFRSVAEYPIALVLACALVPGAGGAASGLRDRARDFALPALLWLCIAAVAAASRWAGYEWTRIAFVLLAALLAFPLFAFRRRPLRFALGVAAVFLVQPAHFGIAGRTLCAERSFFGVHRVVLEADSTGSYHWLLNGTTVHGIQRTSNGGCGEPLSYYTRSGPAGDIFATAGTGAAPRRVGVTGLGCGSLAAYARPGEPWTFYEIDPAVVRIARDPRWFCFLSRSAAHSRYRLGDARRSLAADSTARYDLLVLDAYSSDAIPVHLLTREALQVYVQRLAPHGILALHISNRFFDLAPVVERLATDAGLACRVREDRTPSGDGAEAGRQPSVYAVLARAPDDLGALAADPRWRLPRPGRRAALWTDDYSSLVSVLR